MEYQSHAVTAQRLIRRWSQDRDHDDGDKYFNGGHARSPQLGATREKDRCPDHVVPHAPIEVATRSSTVPAISG
jgi:hypothetical protein